MLATNNDSLLLFHALLQLPVGFENYEEQVTSTFDSQRGQSYLERLATGPQSSAVYCSAGDTP